MTPEEKKKIEAQNDRICSLVVSIGVSAVTAIIVAILFPQ
nr:MAG TPA: hypothetical protein [Caudoviricetes sp.]